MKTNKILIMMLYYERPKLVREALKSLVRANEHHKNWRLAFHDDASPTPGEAIVREILPDFMMDRVTFYRTVATKEQKLASGGMIGHVMNQMIRDSTADVAIMLCDDDVLHAHYLKNLNGYFRDNPDEQACYSHVVVFDPSTETWEQAKNTDNPLNHYSTSLNPAGKLDACQVAWRTRVNKDLGVWFPYPCHKNHDTAFYNAMYEKIGTIPFCGFIGQYKGIHSEQLSQEGQPQAVELVVEKAMKAAMNHYLKAEFNEAQRLYQQVLRATPMNQLAIQMLTHCHFRLSEKG
jgi:hypothetical protein